MSENYHSRVFTFVSRRTNQLKDTCAKGLRHLKVAIVWSGQILLYPLHLLAQTKLFQLQLTPPRSSTALPQPVSDISIEQALELIEVAGYPILLAPQDRSRLSEQQSSSTIELAQTAAVTVDDWSFIDENLWNTTYGNTAIKDREITYSPRKSRQVNPRKPTIRGLSSLLIDRQLVLVTIDNQILDILTPTQQQEIRRRIGIDLAIGWHQWSAGKLSGNPGIDRQLAGREQLLLPDQTQLDRDISPQNLFERLTNWFQTKTKTPPQNLPSPLDSIPSIVSKSPARLSPARYSFTPQPPQLDRALELPQLPPIKETEEIISPDRSIGQTITNLQPDWLKQLWNSYRDYIYIPSPTESKIVHQSQEFELIPIEPKITKIISTKPSPTQIKIPKRSTKLVDKKPHNLQIDLQDWIETESEAIGYSRSPIARFIAWLDRMMLSIENWLIKIWHKIANRPSSD